MNKSRAIFTFLMLCTSKIVFGQFHTITQHSKLYNIEQVSANPDMENNQITQADNVNKASIHGYHNKPIDNQTPAATSSQHPSDSLRQEYINRYLSVSFPMKHLVINSPFGQRKDPFTGKKRNHNGLDLRASSDEVYAMLDGTVKKTGEDKRSGKYIIIQYGEYFVSYCHLSRIWVEQGTLVRPGEIVGITGNTGRSTGPHLHITCKRNNKYIDPAILIQFIKEVKENTIRYLCNAT